MKIVMDVDTAKPPYPPALVKKLLDTEAYVNGWPHIAANRKIGDGFTVLANELATLAACLESNIANYEKRCEYEARLATVNNDLIKIKAGNSVLEATIQKLANTPGSSALVTTSEGNKIVEALETFLKVKGASLETFLKVKEASLELGLQEPITLELEDDFEIPAVDNRMPAELREQVSQGYKFIDSALNSLLYVVYLEGRPSDIINNPTSRLSELASVARELSATNPVKLVEKLEEAITLLGEYRNTLQTMMNQQPWRSGVDELVTLEKQLTIWIAMKEEPLDVSFGGMTSYLRGWLADVGEPWEITSWLTKLSEATVTAAQALSAGVEELQPKMARPDNEIQGDSRIEGLRAAQADIVRHLQVCTNAVAAFAQRQGWWTKTDRSPLSQDQFELSTETSMMELCDMYLPGGGPLTATSKQQNQMELSSFVRCVGAFFLDGTLQSYEKQLSTERLWDFFPWLSTHVVTLLNRAQVSFSIDFEKQPPIETKRLN